MLHCPYEYLNFIAVGKYVTTMSKIYTYEYFPMSISEFYLGKKIWEIKKMPHRLNFLMMRLLVIPIEKTFWHIIKGDK